MENFYYSNFVFYFLDLNKLVDCSIKLFFVCEKYNVFLLEKYSLDFVVKV